MPNDPPNMGGSASPQITPSVSPPIIPPTDPTKNPFQTPQFATPTNPPQSNTPDPENLIHSEVAKRQERDEHGRFIKQDDKDNEKQPNEPIVQAPPLIHASEAKEYKKDDPPLINLQVTNPITYFKLWLKRLLKNEGIDLRLRVRPLTAIAIGLAVATFFTGTGFGISKLFFPNSSPILKREVVYQGRILMSENGQYLLSLPDGYAYKLHPTNTTLVLNNYLNKQVQIKGNLTPEPGIINLKEIIAYENTINY